MNIIQITKWPNTCFSWIMSDCYFFLPIIILTLAYSSFLLDKGYYDNQLNINHTS